MEDSDTLSPLTTHRSSRQASKRKLLLRNQKPEKKCNRLCRSLDICTKSKASLLLLVWSVLLGAIYISLLNSFSVLGYVVHDSNTYRAAVWTVLGAYAMLALIRLVYPLSGFLADTCCGRYKAITLSFIVLLVAMLSLSIAAIIAYVLDFKFNKHHIGIAAPFTLLVIIALLLITAGLAGYQANIIQFGLDQLLEAPSRNLGLFIHWLMWTHTLGAFVIHVLFAIFPCHLDHHDPLKNRWRNTLAGLPIIYLVAITGLLIVTFYNHNWFYSEPGRSNPYKMVFKVLNFARKHKYPLRRSAFTYCDDEIPNRIDFGKERYGGPFTTEQVEDVKTFLRIVLVLLTLGPVFILEVPASYYIFPFFTLHISKSVDLRHLYCVSESRWVIMESGALGYIVSILFIPVYIWVIYSLLQNRMPKILNRMWCMFLTALVGVVSLLVIDLIGHILYKKNSPSGYSGMCMFSMNIAKANTYNFTSLDLPTSLNIIPSLILNPSFLLVETTAFEFISAQSPLSMKGLLVGVYFAIKGVFQVLSAVAVVPFALDRIWIDMVKQPPLTNCAFGYYLFTIATATVGLVLFSLVARKYRYRQRDERPYDQRFAEQYYQQCISERLNKPTLAEQSERERLTSETESLESSSYDYGATDTEIELSESTSSAARKKGGWLSRLINKR